MGGREGERGPHGDPALRAARALPLLALALALAGCIGAYQVPVVEPQGAGSLRPVIEDPDAGMVGIARGLDLKSYPVIAVAQFRIPESEINDSEDRRLAAELPPYFQSAIVRRLRASGLFERVVNLTESELAPGGARTLRLEGAITKLSPGNRALRYFVGFGAGASRTQVETRFVDVQTGEVVLVTADRREAAFGIFGGDSEEHLKESFDDMARDLSKFVARTRGASPAAGAAPASGAPQIARTDAASRVVGTWRGTLRYRGEGSSVSLPVTLQIFEQGAGLMWSLVSSRNPTLGAGTVELAGDTLRLAGHTQPVGPRVAITYSGTVVENAYEASGLTADNRTHVLSVTRVAP